MKQGKRDAFSILGIGAAAALTAFIISAGFKVSSEASRSIRRDISGPLGELTSVSKYWSIYMQLLLAQKGYGAAMFTNIPCDWGPIVGLNQLPINDSPEVPLYFIPTDLIQHYGYASEYASLSAMGVANKMMCLEQVNGTYCDCNLEVSYPTPQRYVHQHVYQGNEFKYYDRTVFSSVWIDEDGYVVDRDGEYKIPRCVTKKKKRSSLSKSYTVKFTNHYMNIYVCVDADYELSARFKKQSSLFTFLAVFLGILAAFFCVYFKHSNGVKIGPTTSKKTSERYDPISSISTGDNCSPTTVQPQRD